MRDRRELTCAPDLERNAFNDGLDLLGRELIRDGEARRLTGVPERLLLRGRFNLQYDAVNLIINFLSRRRSRAARGTPFPLLPICKNFFKGIGMLMFPIHR